MKHLRNAKTYKAVGGGAQPVQTVQAAGAHRRGAPKTARATGKRGLHDLLELYNGLSGFHANTLGLGDFKTTYGEVSEQGTHTLSDKFQTYAPLSKISAARKNFYDLGSGIGRLVVGIAILNSEIQAHGIEIVPDRIRAAREAMNRIKHKDVARRIHISQGSFLEPNTSYRDACWIFISNILFNDATQKGLSEKIEREVGPGTVIICCKELFFDKTKMESVATAIIPMTWSKTSVCYIYRRL